MASSLKEVVYRREDGATVKAVAHYRYRRGPIGKWMLGDKPLEDMRDQIISETPLDDPLPMKEKLCEFCFRVRSQETELERLKRGDYVLIPASEDHARDMIAVATTYLQRTGNPKKP